MTSAIRYQPDVSVRQLEDWTALRGEIDPSFIITHRVGLDDAPDMYKTFREKQDGCVKVVMRPS